jgi:hypothetical protein
MPADTTGPMLGQALTVYQGASKTVSVTVPDPTGAYSTGSATAEWRAGPKPPTGLAPSQATTLSTVFAHKTSGLAVSVPSAGTVQVTFTIQPADIAAFAPSNLPLYQHECWMTASGVAQPVAIGPLTVVGTVAGEAGWPG